MYTLERETGGWALVYNGFVLYRGMEAVQGIALLQFFGVRPKVLQGTYEGED